MSAASSRHTPVMLDRCVELLAPALERPGAIAVDATLGLGGHAEALLLRCPRATVVGIDRDRQALDLARERLAPFGDRFVAHHATYDDIAGALDAASAPEAHGVLFDLGVSSLQVDDPGRGFSYAQDAPLDMRMGQHSGPTAADLLRDEPEQQLARILREYGEERFASRIARAVVRRRAQRPVERSGDLVEIVRQAIPAAARAQGGNPAKRTFQALRIAVNRELDILAAALPAALLATPVGGRVAVLAYHSLEDRMVKRAFAAGAEVDAPPGMPVVPEDAQPYLRLLTRGAERPDADEVERNPRSRPARLRAVERLRPTPAHRRAA